MSSNKDCSQEHVICARELSKRYGNLTAVNAITFSVMQNERLGFLGPNGAGKSTIIKMLYGMTPPTSGALEVLGLDIKTHTRAIKYNLGIVAQENNLDTEMNVIENFEVFAHYFGIDRNVVRKRAEELLDFMHLSERSHVMVDELSGGMKRRLMIARALINKPKLLILDEPTTGLDPQARHLIWDRLKELTKQNVTIILTTHYMDEASSLCKRILIMDEGTIVAEGSPQGLIDQHISKEALELQIDPSKRQSFIELLAPLSNGYEAGQETIIFFTQNADFLLRKLKESDLTADNITMRQVTLEDVFLKLTGRRLRD